MEIIRVLTDSGQPIFLTEEDGRYIPLPDDFWRRKIPNYRYFTENGRQKQQKKLLKTADVKTVCAEADQPPAWRKIHNDDGKHPPTATDCRQGVEALMSLLDVFPTPEAGAMLLATLLMGLRAADLKQCEPSLRPCVAFRGPPQLEPTMRRLFKHILPRKQWDDKRFSIRRERVVDLNDAVSLVDISRVKIRVDKLNSIWLPLPPENTVLLVLHGRDTAWGKLSDDLSQVGVVFVNGVLSANGWGAASVPTYTVSAWDDDLLENIIAKAPRAAWLLGWWWGTSRDDWAQDVIRRAHVQLGNPGGRFHTFAYEPKALCRAVAYQVLLDFVALTGDRQWLPPDKTDTYRQRLQDIFDPAPLPPSTALRRAEDAGVYLEVLRKFATERAELIAPLEQPYVRPRRGKIAAAWRHIGGEKYLVMDEGIWETWYAKALKSDHSVDATLLQRPKWGLELQKLLGQAGVIKIPASGYRYRYDLLGNGTRDSTYVVATSAKLLQEAGQKAGQNAPPPARPIAGPLARDNEENTNDLYGKGGE